MRKEFWKGKHSAISKTMQIFDLDKDKKNFILVKSILNEVLDSLAEDQYFSNKTITKKKGRNPVLEIKSTEAMILTNTIECGL